MVQSTTSPRSIFISVVLFIAWNTQHAWSGARVCTWGLIEQAGLTRRTGVWSGICERGALPRRRFRLSHSFPPYLHPSRSLDTASTQNSHPHVCRCMIRRLWRMLDAVCVWTAVACSSLQCSRKEQSSAARAMSRLSAFDSKAQRPAARAHVDHDMRHCDETCD